MTPATYTTFVQEQEKKQRVRGIDAQKSNIQAARAITRILKSSLGPKGMDKMLQGPDGDVCISKCSAWPHSVHLQAKHNRKLQAKQ